MIQNGKDFKLFKMKKRIAIIGLGYVGLPLLCIIEKCKKFEVVGFDIDKDRINKILKEEINFDDEIVRAILPKIKPNINSDPEILKSAVYFFICVPTPVKNDFSPDLEPLKKASSLVGKYLKKDSMVIIESTINPGVCEEIILPILEKESGLKGGENFGLAHCPERIDPGNKKWNILNIPRNVGGLTPVNTKEAADLYRQFINAKVIELSCLKSAEATKIVENTFRDINIAYVNELAKSFNTLGIDLIEVIKGASSKPFAFMPHWPGCGVGGHCIPVDPYYLIERAKKNEFDHRFLRIAREINNSMPRYTVDLLISALNEARLPVKDTKIALLGMSYKRDVGDLRQSPAIKIKKYLEELGADLAVFDPYLPEHSNVDNLEDALNRSRAVMIATDHKVFIEKLPELILKSETIRVFIDGRNCLDKNLFLKSKILYKGIGR